MPATAVHPTQREAGRSRSGREAAAAFLVALGVTLAFFAPMFGGRTFSTTGFQQRAVYPWAGLPGPDLYRFPQTDQTDLSYPWQAYQSDAMDRRAFPFWNPHNYVGGYPFFSNGSSGVLYPPRLLTAVTTRPDIAHDLLSLLNVLLSGLFMYAFLREIRVGFWGAVLGEVAWMLGSFNLAWLHLDVIAPVAVFTPLCLWLVHRAFRVRTAWSVTIAGLSLGLTLMGGQILFMGSVWATAMAFAFGQVAVAVWRVRRRIRDAAPQMIVLIAIAIVSLGSAAVVLLPSFGTTAEAARQPFTYDELKESWLTSPSTFLHTFYPPPRPVTEGRMHQMAFAGTATAAFACVGLFVRRPGAWFARTLLALMFAINIRGPGSWVAFHILPGFRIFRPYARLLFLWIFALSVLAAIGMDAVTRWRAGADGPSVPRRRIVRACTIGVALVAITATGIELLRYGRAINPPFVARMGGRLLPATPAIRAAQQDVHAAEANGWPGRILPVRAINPGGRYVKPMLFANMHLLFRLDSASGYDSVVPARIAALVRVLEGTDPRRATSGRLPSAYAPTFPSPMVRFDLAERLGITTIVATPLVENEVWSEHFGRVSKRVLYQGRDGRVLHILGVEPGPRLIYAHDVARDGTEALTRFVDPSFDARHRVIVERSEFERLDAQPADTGAGSGRILTARRGINDARLVVTSTAPGWLLVPDSWSEGWTATVNGEATDVWRINYTQRAVRVPAGRSTVSLRYRPPFYRMGVIISLATMLLSVAVPLLRRRRLKLKDRPPSPHTATRTRS